MSQRLLMTTIFAVGLLGTTAPSPAFAQTAQPAAPAANPQGALGTSPSPANPHAAPGAQPSASPSAGIVVLVDPTNKPPETAETHAGTASQASDREAFFEAHLAALRAGLTLGPDQEKLWPALEQAIRKVSAARLDKRHGGMAVLDPDPNNDGSKVGAGTLDPFDAVKASGTLLLDRGKALQSLADAADPLYSTLTPEQRRRVPVLVRSFAPNNMKLRQLLALMTWDADVSMLEQTERRSSAQQSGPHGGPQASADDDQQESGPSMRRGARQGWYAHPRDYDDEAEDASRSDRRFGQPDTRSADGMMSPHGGGYGDDGPDE